MLPPCQRLHIEMVPKVACVEIREKMGGHNERDEQKSTDQGAVKKHRDNGVIDDGALFENVVKAQ